MRPPRAPVGIMGECPKQPPDRSPAAADMDCPDRGGLLRGALLSGLRNRDPEAGDPTCRCPARRRPAPLRGVPQEGDRLGSDNAPVTIQVFNDLQCAACREDFLRTVPTLAEDYARPGDVQLLYRHYSNSENIKQLGFSGPSAAAETELGWQSSTSSPQQCRSRALRWSTRNSSKRSPPGSKNSSSRNGSRTWNGTSTATAISRRLDGYEELGSDLGIRVRQAAIVTGPEGTRTLQDGPTLGQIERAIEAVE